MRDFALAPSAVSPLTGGLADSVFDTAARTPTLPVLARRRDPASVTWEEVTAVELRDEVVDLAKGFVASGISPGHRVAIMARTRYEWTVLSYALWAVGAEVVPVYPTSSREQVEWILRDSGCVGVVVEDEQSVMTVGSVCATLRTLRHVWQLDAGAFEDLTRRGERVPLTTVDSLRRIVLPDSTAVIAYTSGTSGRPLGCALTHAGLASPCDTLLAGWGHTAAPAGEQGSVLAFLPFSHVYGLMIQGLCIRGGIMMGHEPDLSTEALAEALRTFRPTYLYAVPSVYEKIYKNFLRSAQEAGRGALFERAAETARDFAAAVERHRLGRGSGPGLDLRLQHSVFERTVYRKLRASLGGRVHRGTSGGSPLTRDLSLFYEGIGIYVHDGYGLTETSGGITMQPLGQEKSGTVGQVLPGMDLRVADDGEILVRGPSVFQGYVNDDASTRAALRGGWLATGDLGFLDSDGYLTITGRKKDVIITSSGKSVAPTALEQRLRMHPLVHQAVVVGDNRPCVGALITLDPEFLAHWRGGLMLHGDTSSREAREENALREEIARAVAAANSAVSRSESIRAFRILPQPFDQSNGLLTPSMKLRRDSIVAHYAAEIEAMYQARARLPRQSAQEEVLTWDDTDDVFR
ncbi:AMP-dependent synthetase/ligase [Streptomyces antibioticus]|uniref:Long-chain fatty acid--CoA ligase n=1 Tax=Streptomyces antibioticus TaxID=1890 RepID=A0AAE7CIX0_STRAT|nr:AMP-dependent synthetase/ligase [Streptomyces antibioticus]MCX4743393.1 AMP-dependent synthetase/ligase [Streptomyces antibioticus]MCX5166968.1 AMP-dependent synthetase/ligase [Streptomyces antibioticus]OOQ54946.1 long-chain fatty acid--CoA ligase [Streptomyces antibioticus]QIT42589.1 long-chain fatty acid--CoA ligase [Streptomyces antibioticus]